MPWLRHFALFLVFVAALFRPAAAGAFVSAPDAGSQTRVGAFELVAATLVGPASAATCGLHEGIGEAYDENASGYRFATRGVAEVARHHAWPKYLGGAAKQDLVTLPRKMHEAFHSGLDKILPRQWGAEYYQKLSPAAKEQVLRDLADYTRAFDAKHGTSIFDALVKAGFPSP